MPLVTSTEMLLKAQAEHYAVGAFNVENMEMIQSVLEVAETLQAPVLLQTTGGTLKYAVSRLFHAMAEALAAHAAVPVALHLDHGNSPELCLQVMDAGYTSVMIDGSRLSFEDNVDMTRKVVDFAVPRRIPVEAELGAMGGKEDDHTVSDKEALYTNPHKALEFIERTGANSLAVAIGTAHGFYKGEPKLDFERLAAIRDCVSVPLVLHGASGLSAEAVQQAVSLGISKVNFATELRDVYTRSVRMALHDPAVFDPKIYGMAGRRSVAELVEHKMRVCGCVGMA